MNAFRTDMTIENIPKKTIVLEGVGKKYPFTRISDRQRDMNFEEFWALRDVSFTAEAGQIVGVIGRNGAGKSTLLSIISGSLSPTHGVVDLRGKATGLFNLGIGFQDEFSGRENIFLNGALMGATRKELEDKIERIIAFSELGDFIDMPLGSYSQGMRLRLGFGIAAHLDFDILLLDEILAVGDVLFQNKCFEKIMDLKREGKTLLVSSQSLELIQRLCDSVALLDHGRLLFCGAPREGIDKYRGLLATEKFFVGPSREAGGLIEDTKKWADDVSGWGEKLGTKEVTVDSVSFLDRFGFRCNRVHSGDPLKIEVNFTVRNRVKNPHFGVAIFRSDGVYCYGPNTDFDDWYIPELKPGKGSFSLHYANMLLAPGDYRVSIAIWDSQETVAFDYHQGFYPLSISGFSNAAKELLNIPCKTSTRYLIGSPPKPPAHLFNGKSMQKTDNETIQIESIRLIDDARKEANVFMTGQPLELAITLNVPLKDTQAHIWVGFYRQDDIYCQGVTMPAGRKRSYAVRFPKAYFLPGAYKISFGIWDQKRRRILMYRHGLLAFNMVFNRPDHGTVYMAHKWKWEAR